MPREIWLAFELGCSSWICQPSQNNLTRWEKARHSRHTKARHNELHSGQVGVEGWTHGSSVGVPQLGRVKAEVGLFPKNFCCVAECNLLSEEISLQKGSGLEEFEKGYLGIKIVQAIGRIDVVLDNTVRFVHVEQKRLDQRKMHQSDNQKSTLLTKVEKVKKKTRFYEQFLLRHPTHPPTRCR